MGAPRRARSRKVPAVSFDPLRFHRGEPLPPFAWLFFLTVAVVATAVSISGVSGLIALAVVSAVVIALAHRYGARETAPVTTGRRKDL
jgi:hypothetical protein